MSLVRQIVINFYRYGLIKLGEFKLSSGLQSPFYIDVRRMYSYPDLTRHVITELATRVPLHDVDVLAGVESAGIPLAAYLSCLVNKPLAYVRKERKMHGTSSTVEGDVHGKRVAILDDVATTGSSLVKAIGFLREANAIPIKAIVIVDREQGAERALKLLGVEFYALLRAREIFNILLEQGLVSLEDYNRIVEYLDSFKRVSNDV